ncbi:MAG: LacI family DNA-binding transcriptional regulator [bacterium]|nr:LacI family DNA-binding transcriptional regulator [bacterium]
MVNIRHVAARAGVSVTSVSNVLNDNKGTVSEEKRRLILQTIEEMGYRPNRRVRQLRKQANLTIAVQIDSTAISSNIWRPTIALDMILLQGIGRQAEERGYHTHILIPEQSRDIEDIYRQVIKENAVDGIVLVGFSSALDDCLIKPLLEELKQCAIPCVTRDTRLYAQGVPYVIYDLSNGINAAAGRLADLGHKRGAYIGTVDRKIINSCPPRFCLFESCLAKHGLSFAEELVFDERTEFDAYRRTLQIIDNDILPTFIVYSSDHLAMTGLEAMHDRGIKVPRDVSLVSIDNAPYAATARVPLATIDQHHLEQGRVLARVLLDQVENKGASAPDITLVRSDFIERDSLGGARGES